MNHSSLWCIALILEISYFAFFHLFVFPAILLFFTYYAPRLFCLKIYILYVTGPAKIGHVGTDYTLSRNMSYLSTGIELLLYLFCNLHCKAN